MMADHPAKVPSIGSAQTTDTGTLGNGLGRRSQPIGNSSLRLENNG